MTDDPRDVDGCHFVPREVSFVRAPALSRNVVPAAPTGATPNGFLARRRHHRLTWRDTPEAMSVKILLANEHAAPYNEIVLNLR